MPEGLTVDWQALTAIAAVIYTIFTAGSVILIYTQLKELIKNRIVQTSLALFDILQKPEARKARKYIHDNMPVKVKKLNVDDLEKHLEGMFEAVVGFDRIGYFLKRGYINEDEIVPLFWAIVWRCWNKE